ncbi:MAG: SDR family oxidoreductase [Anaerolineales bacterium]
MNLTIFGATGKTGRLLVEQALAKGHTVTALARSPAKLAVRHDRLKIIQGDIRDSEKVTQAIAGADAVISVLGPTSNKPLLAVSQGMDNILAAMRQLGVRRLIQSAGAGVRDPKDQPTLVHAFFGGLVRLLSPNVVKDMEQVVEKVRGSGLDWTVVRVPMLTEDPATGRIREGYVGKDIGPRLSRDDMAGYLLRQVESNTYLGQAPAISN